MNASQIRALPARRVDVPPALTDEETVDLLGTLMDDRHYDHDKIFRENVDVFCAETGAPLLMFRKGVVPKSEFSAAYNAYESAATETFNRGLAAGKITPERAEAALKSIGGVEWKKQSETRMRVKAKDGTWMKTTFALPVASGIVGFYPRSRRAPYCRLTAFTQAHFKKFKSGLPVVRRVDSFYEALLPENYAAQKAEAERTSPDFVIPNTSFTTVTVNKNWQTAAHTDQGDFDGGFGNLVAIRKGRYEGGYTILPQWRCGVDVENGDILLMDVHRVHGNTPIKKIDPGATRLSLVMYYRADMILCASEAEEISRARSSSVNSQLDIDLVQEEEEDLK